MTCIKNLVVAVQPEKECMMGVVRVIAENIHDSQTK